MDKEFLKALMQEKAGSYAAFLEGVAGQTKSQRWGTGAVPPYSLLPYRLELLGLKPGRFLKAEAEPGKNKYQYFLDGNERVIGCLEYLGQQGDGWLVKWDFYEHSDGRVVLYRFDSALESDKEASLTLLNVADLDGGRVSRAGELTFRGAYSESDYVYEGDAIGLIKLRTWPGGTLVERTFEPLRDGDQVQVFEQLKDGTRKKIYPKG